MNEPQDRNPTQVVLDTERALNRKSRAVDEARREHQEASQDYIAALRAFFEAHAAVAAEPEPCLPPRANESGRPIRPPLPLGRDDER